MVSIEPFLNHALPLFMLLMAVVPVFAPARDVDVRLRLAMSVFFLLSAMALHWLVPVCYLRAWSHTFMGWPADASCL